MISDDKDSGLPSAYDILAGYNGEPAQFWRRLCDYAVSSMAVEGISLLLKGAGGESEIRVLSQSPDGAARRLGKSGATAALNEVETTVFGEMPGIHGRRFFALSMPAREGLLRLWMVAEGVLKSGEGEKIERVSKEVRLLTDMYQARRQEQRTDLKLTTLTEALDLGLALGEAKHFKEAALRACGELSAPMRASRVSLAWIEGQDLKLKATSHGGRISANSEEARAIEQVVEEATDQDNEVTYPEMAGANAISREHRQFSAARENECVLSVPLRHQGEVLGGICLERPLEEGAWTSSELDQVRLLSDLAIARLESLHSQSGWLGRRIWRSLRRKSSRWLGPENTGWKLSAILIPAIIVSLALIRIEHKVAAPFILKTDLAAIISAPFPGYVENALYHLGDVVELGQLLVELDRKELLLEESDTMALLGKNQREARRHEADENLAQMQVSRAESDQAEARLAIIRHRLGQTRIKAPFDGIIVEGDLRERLSSPVQAGEELLKIVQLDQLFGQLQVDDRDISYLKSGSEGELAFASRPGEKFSVKIDRFEPVAEIRPEGSVFLLRAQIKVESESWWRPGMSGICKIDVGKRSLLWIAGHRLIETLRLWLWI